MSQTTYRVTVGADAATIRRKGESRVRVASILGRETRDGFERIYLDRLVVPAGDFTLDDTWSSSGCVSTILIRQIDTPAAAP